MTSNCKWVCNYLTKLIQPIVLWLCSHVGVEVVQPGMRQISVKATVLPKDWMMFDPALAQKIGLPEAIVFQQIKAWILSNEREGKYDHYKEDCWWTWGDYTYWQKTFFKWCSDTSVGRYFRKLEQLGYLTAQSLRKGDSTKWYALGSGQAGITLVSNWHEADSNMTLPLWQSDTTYNSEATKQKPSRSKRQSTTPTRAPKSNPLTVGVVANFPKPSENRDLPEMHPVMVEPSSSDIDGEDSLRPLDFTETPAKPSADQTSPSSAPPPPLAQQFCAEIREFWPTCAVDTALHDLIAKRGEAHALAVIEYVRKQKPKNAQGLARTLLAQNFMPPGYPLVALPDDESHEDTTESHFNEPDEDTRPDSPDKAIPPKPETLPEFDADCPEAQAWHTAYSQLEIQLDRATFDTWLRSAFLWNVQGQALTIAVPNTYVRDMLQYRMYRDVRRMVNDCTFGQQQPLELVFEVHQRPAEVERDLPLARLLKKANVA